MEMIVKIKGMKCEHCEKRVKEVLTPLAEEVKVSHVDGESILKNVKVNADTIKKAIEDLDFEVTEIINK